MIKITNDDPAGRPRTVPDRNGAPKESGNAKARQARLEQALRSNLLKRKEKKRERAAASSGVQEGGTDPKGAG